ncbi:hypothetical protein B0H14DRAFT_3179336 [Mycena olivaceomarginata]|nr:hypothetical protein B0H14DRAFT_3179336 [Mycena olivaceomarginata]
MAHHYSPPSKLEFHYFGTSPFGPGIWPKWDFTSTGKFAGIPVVCAKSMVTSFVGMDYGGVWPLGGSVYQSASKESHLRPRHFNWYETPFTRAEDDRREAEEKRKDAKK